MANRTLEEKILAAAIKYAGDMDENQFSFEAGAELLKGQMLAMAEALKAAKSQIICINGGRDIGRCEACYAAKKIEQALADFNKFLEET